MEKWLKRDIDLSEKLYGELEAIDLEKPKIKEKQDKLKPQMRKAFAKYNLGLAHGDGDAMVEARTTGQKLFSEKFNIQDSWYRKRTAVENQLREINAKYIIASTLDLTKLFKQLLGLRKFEITDKRNSGEKGLPFYFISHNWVSIGKVVEELMGTMDKIRNSDLAPLFQIKATYEEAVKNIPDDFPLTDEAQGGENMFSRFREGMGSAHIEIVPDDFITMSMDQAKTIGDVGRLQSALNGLKKFFKLEENSFRSTQTQRGSRWPII